MFGKENIGLAAFGAELRPFIKGVIRDLKCVLFIGLDFSHTVCIVVIYKQRVDYANKYTCVVERVGDWFIISAGVLHNDLRFAGQSLHSLYELAQRLPIMRNLKGFCHDYAKGLHDCSHALAFGYVDTYCVHNISPIIEFVIGCSHTLLITYSVY